MTTNLVATVVLTLVTNLTNIVYELPLGTGPIFAPESRPSLQRIVSTNVFERSTITWTLNGQTNTCTHDRLIYSASQVMKLKEVWEPSTLTINQP